MGRVHAVRFAFASSCSLALGSVIFSCGPSVGGGGPGSGACTSGKSITCGVGACQTTVPACVDGKPQACVPGAAADESCNGIDDNCDGDVDEGCPCIEGAQQACYPGSMASLGVGECAPGLQTCKAGQWGACEAAVVPDDEVCDGKDNDCNGIVDDGLGTVICGVGACRVVVLGCQAGAMPSCIPGTPTTEVCNGIDDDCNGEIDDGLGTVTCGMGPCAQTVPACAGGQPNPCIPKQESPEICDGIDNNCNGQVDEGTISCGVGACAVTVPACANGAPNPCVPNDPTPEVCDAIDNDCNGVVDDGETTCGLGQCAVTVPLCTNGAPTPCIPGKATPEICDGIDNDCNGAIDDIATNPIVYFNEPFANNLTGWTLGPEWQIGPTAASSCTSAGPDPSTDHTSTADNGVAGVALGGCELQVPHGYYYLTSPKINLTAASTVYLEFWRWLNSDYPPYMTNDVEVFNGATWVVVWVQPSDNTLIMDSAWTNFSYDVSAYKNANFQVRFGFKIESTGVFQVGSWTLDDVRLVSAVACP